MVVSVPEDLPFLDKGVPSGYVPHASSETISRRLGLCWTPFRIVREPQLNLSTAFTGWWRQQREDTGMLKSIQPLIGNRL